MHRFEEFQVLVIVSAAKLRAQLHVMLPAFGFAVTHFAISARTALRHLRARRYELILCDYALEGGQDGQHLLEDLRQHEIIARDTLFVMITGERNYECVLGAAELLPDDYILTPLVAGALRERLVRIADRREAFLPAWRLSAAGDWLGAIDYCLRAQGAYPHYLVDFHRLEAELYIAAGRVDEAGEIYRQIIAAQSMPWARLGLARCLALKKEHAEADALLAGLIAEHAHFMAAYDLLARVRAASGQGREACEVLRAAIERSPYRLERQRQLGELAMETGEAATAEAALAEVVRQSAHSGFRNPEDHVRLVRAQLAQGKADAARATIGDLERNPGGQPGTALCTALASAMVHAHAGDAARARASLAAAEKLTAAGVAAFSPRLAREMVGICFDQGLEEMGSDVAANILRATSDEQTMLALREMLGARGLGPLSKRIEQDIQEEVRRLIMAGAEKARIGDYGGAVAAMTQAVRQMPGHPVVLFNAALALLRHIEHRGWNDALAHRARALIERARALDPASGRLSMLAEFMHLLIERDGIAVPDAAPARRRARPNRGRAVQAGKEVRARRS
ncbi:MAG: response regulator [Azoarcus sp.]|jgi:CheY-like chemotaxis protein|nr:response regulator [Azoarcus sp.]